MNWKVDSVSIDNNLIRVIYRDGDSIKHQYLWKFDYAYDRNKNIELFKDCFKIHQLSVFGMFDGDSITTAVTQLRKLLTPKEVDNINYVNDFTKPVEIGKNKALEDACDLVPKMVNAVKNYDAVKDLVGEIWWSLDGILNYNSNDVIEDNIFIYDRVQPLFHLHKEKIKFIEKCVKEWREKVEKNK